MGQLISKKGLTAALLMSASIFLTCQDAVAEEPIAITPDHVAEVLMQHSSRKTDKQFSLLIIHLTREELAELADKLLKLTQIQVKAVAVLEAELPSAKGSVADQVAAEIETGMRRRNLMFRKLYLILNEWEAKGGNPEEIEKYKQYGKAVARSERKVGDPDAIRKMFTEWLTSPDGGVRIAFLLFGLVVSIIVVIIFSWVFAGLVRHALSRTEKISILLRNFLSRAAYWVILALGIVTVLSLYGINMTPLLAAFGGASFIIGFATQSALSNFASGLLLMINRPFDEGDFITTAGTSGTVKSVSIVSTTITTPDNQVIVVPNSKVWGDVITNATASELRRVDLQFGIDYSDDQDKAIDVIIDVAQADARVLDDPEPWVRVTNLGESSVDLTARLWCKAENYWELKFALTRAVKLAFDENGISIPYPHNVEITKAG